MNYELLIAPENREWCEWANETNQAKLAPFVYSSYSRSPGGFFHWVHG
jgi:hypothetical protein